MFLATRRHPQPTHRNSSTRKAKRTITLILEALEDRTVPTLVGNQLFPADNPWNQKITNAPVATNSTAIINNISSAGNGRIHPDFGQDYHDSSDLYGIPYNIVHGNSTPKTNVVIDAYSDESDVQGVPLPANVVIEGDFQNGPNVGVDNRGDSHLLIYDADNSVAYEFYRASRPSENADGKWHADQETVWDMKANTFRTLGYTSADAAGLSLLVGLVRPDEGLPVSEGGQGVINHAIRFTLQNSIILNQFLYPASHVANGGNTNASIMPAMGARFRLKASVDISTLNPEARVIAQAMKDYGMIVADNGSNFYFSGASYAVDASNQQTLTWNDNDIQDSVHGLKSLHFADFEVVDLTPAVTDLSLHTGSAGNTVTVTGRNFTGAAGHLLVLFGNTPATNVTVVNDTTVTAVVPAGLSGTVDVRVQSGVTTGTNSQNYTSPVFGYGVSAISTGDRFTIGGATNQPPTVATPAKASSNPVTGTSVVLSVLGADDGGEANLKYTWTSTGPASVVYSPNGNNAAKNTTVTFTQPGNYAFTVTIADAQGLTVTSSVNVTVVINQPPTVATPAKASSNPVAGTSVVLSVLGADDGGEANLKYTWNSTGPASVLYSPNGNNSAKNTTVTFSQPGNYAFTVTIADAQGLTVTSSVNVTVVINQPPTVATPAKASSNPVAGTTVNLSVLGADDGGEANLKYTWSSTGPAPVLYSPNGSNAAKNTTVTFSQPGNYVFTVTLADTQGLTVSSSVNVTVTNHVPTVAIAAKASSNPVTGSTVNLSVLGADDGGEANLKYTWSSTGPAPVLYSPNGTNAAKNTTVTFSKSGSYAFTATITDAAGLKVTSAVTVTVHMNQAPTISKPATASASTVTGHTVSLSALGLDDGGAANLTYSWVSSGPAAVTFSRNGTNAAQNTGVTFSQAGDYSFTVTIKDAQGLSVTSTVKVHVKQTLTKISVTPLISTMKVHTTLQFSAISFDQFSNALLTQPTITWTLSSAGSITSKGLYTAPHTPGGPYYIIATAGSIRGVAKVTIVA
jgi:outer membrane lipoprotein-sorting protein